MALPYPKVPAGKIPAKKKMFDPEELAKLQEQEMKLSEELDYIKENKALPAGETPEREFLNRNVDIEAYTMQLQTELSELAAKRQDLEKKVQESERKMELKRAQTEDIDVEQRRLEGLTAQQIGKERKRQEAMDARIKSKTSELSRYEEKGMWSKAAKARKEKDSLERARNRMINLPFRKAAKIWERHVTEDWKGLHKKQTDKISEIARRIQRDNPELPQWEYQDLAEKEYFDSFPKAIEPSGMTAQMDAAPDLSIDWEEFTIFDPKLETRRRMTREEGATYARQRQVLYTPKTTRRWMEQRKKPQFQYDSWRKYVTGIEKEEKELSKEELKYAQQELGSRLKAPSEISAAWIEKGKELREKRQDIDRRLKYGVRNLAGARAKLAEIPDPKTLSFFLTPEARPGGTVVENHMQHKLRMLVTFASMGTTALLRQASTVTKDPEKKKSDFGYFEILPDAPSILRTKEQGGLEGGDENWLFDHKLSWWDSEAMSAAQATMPMFSTMTKHYPGIVHGGEGTRATAAFLAGLGDILMPVGPEALGLVGAKFLAPVGLGISGTAKTTKTILKRLPQKGFGPRPSKIPTTKKAVRRARRRKQGGIEKETIDRTMTALDKGDRLGYAIATSGLSEANKYIANTWVKAMTVKQINNAFDGNKVVGYGDAVNPMTTPSTIRSMAAEKVGDQLSKSIQLQSKIENAAKTWSGTSFTDDIERFRAYLRTTMDKVPRGTADYKAMQEILDSPDISVDAVRKAFRNQAIAAAGEVKDGILHGAINLRERIARYLDDDVAPATNQYLELFNKRLMAVRIAGGDPALLERLKKGLQADFPEDLFTARTSVAGATPNQIREAARETIKDFVELKLFNRAPNNMVFFSRDLLIDEKLHMDPRFHSAVAAKSEDIYSAIKRGDKGDTTFGDMAEKVAEIIVINRGATAIRRSPEWRGILRNILKKEGISIEQLSRVDDQIKSYFGKKVAKEWADSGMAFTSRQSVAPPPKPLETPPGAPMTERAYRYASGTARERRPFSAKDLPRRLGIQTDIITNKGLAKAQKSLRARWFPPQITERMPVSMHQFMKDIESTGAAVFHEVQKTLKESFRNKQTPEASLHSLVSKTIDEQVDEAMKQLEAAAIRREALNTPEQLEAFLRSQDLGEYLVHFEGEGIISKDKVLKIMRPHLKLAKEREFLTEYLKTFFQYSTEGRLATAIGRIKEHMKSFYISERGLMASDLAGAVAYIREQESLLKGKGMSPYKWLGPALPMATKLTEKVPDFLKRTDALHEAAMGTLINARIKTRSMKSFQRHLDANPELRLELIPNWNAERAGQFLWDGTYGYRVDEVLDGIILEHGGTLTAAERTLLRESEGYLSAMGSLNRAYSNVWKRFNNPVVVKKHLDEMLYAAFRDGMEGLNAKVKEIIDKDTVFKTAVGNASNQLGRAVRGGAEKKIMKETRQKLDLIETHPKDRVLAEKQGLREEKITRRDSDKAARKTKRNEHREAIMDFRAAAEAEEGIYPATMSATEKAEAVGNRKTRMKDYRAEMKVTKKKYWDDNRSARRKEREQARDDQNLIRHSREERKRRYGIVKENVDKFIKKEMEDIQLKYDAHDLVTKKKHGIPEKMTKSEYDIMRKKYHAESQRYNKETFLEREGQRRDRISEIAQSISPRAVDDAKDFRAMVDDIVDKEVMMKFDEVEAIHKTDRDAMRKRLENDVKAGRLSEQHMRSKVYGYNRYKYFDKWNRIDDYTIESYVRHYNPDLDDIGDLVRSVKDEMREWDAVWGMERRNARMNHMNEKRLEWGFPPKDAEAAKAYKKDMKAFAKTQRLEHIKKRIEHRKAQMNKQKLIRDTEAVREGKLARVREHMEKFRDQQKLADEAQKKKWKEERTQKYEAVSEELGLRPPVKGRKEKMQRVAEKVKKERKVLQGDMNKFKDDQRKAFAEFAVKSRERRGLKRILSAEERAAKLAEAMKTKEGLKDNIDLQLLQERTRGAVAARAPHPAKAEFAKFGTYNPDIHPLNDIKKRMVAKLEDKGVNLYRPDDVPVMLRNLEEIVSNPSRDLAVLMGPGFKAKFDAAMKSRDLIKSLEMFAARDKGFLKWFFNTVERARQIYTSGLLGGLGVTRYPGLNFWSAPALMMMTRGVVGTVEDLSVGAETWFRRGKPNDTMFVSRTGKPWTFKEMSEAEARNPLDASASAAEMDTGNIQYLMEVMAGHGDLKARKFYRGWSTLAARNNMARFADFTDSILRRAVFRNGLKRGLTEAQAAREAKDALFDYAKARSSTSNRVIGQFLMFWSFQSESIRALLDALARGEGKSVLHAYRLTRKMAEQQGLDSHGSNMDMARVYRYVTDSFEGHQAVAAGFPVPALESFGMLLEGMGTVTAPMWGNATFQEATERTLEIMKNRAQFRPSIKEAVTRFMDLNDIGAGRGNYVPNPYVAGLPEPAWQMLKDSGWISKVKRLKRRKGKATREGEQWVFKDKKSQHAFENIQSAMLFLSIRRTVEDNFIKLNAELTGSEKGRVPYPYVELGGTMDGLMFISAKKTHMPLPDNEEKIRMRRMIQQNALRR